ncbi:MAG: WG repeat-containing protein [Candidatus Berkelbacteria bacterium]|nr:WG repeat-containing protein [Candidatus Berkelbacteria bacterium]
MIEPNCLEITDKLASKLAVFRDFDKLFDAGNVLKALEKQKELQDFCLETLEKIDPNQIFLRERVARKVDADFVSPFSDGVAWATQNSKNNVDEINFVVNTEGEKIGEYYSDLIWTNFHNGIAWVYSRRGYDGLNQMLLRAVSAKTGQVMIEFHADQTELDGFKRNGIIMISRTMAGSRRETFFLKAENGKLRRLFASKQGETGFYRIAKDFSDEIAWVKDGSTTKFFDENENIVGQSEAADCMMFFGEVTEGLVWLRHATSSEAASLYDCTGKYLFTLPKYHAPHPFHNGLARVVSLGDEGVGYSYYIDQSGKSIAGNYSKASDFSEGLAAVSDRSVPRIDGGKPRKARFIRTDGGEAFSGEWFTASDFHEGLAIVSDRGSEYYFIDKEGKDIFKKRFGMACDFEDGLAKVGSKSRIFYIDKSGREVFEKVENSLNKSEKAKSKN